ncbi:hypothetical protein OBV_02910 [Oscillibacter valericigenes Sjm18-20]|nr:hypothetical protein OBV_02910 [Oscillibacter valericigenes Sjm18-20]
MKRAFLAALAAMLLLSGCGKQAEEPSGLYYEASGIAPDTVLLTVDGREVPAARYFYWLTADCDYLAEQSGGEPDWTGDAGGQTLDEYVKAQALSAAVFYATLESLAESHDCVLTAGDLAAMDKDWADQAAAAGGEDAYLAVLAQKGLDQAGAQLFSADYYLYEQLRELSQTEGNDLAPKSGDVTAYAQAAGLYTADTLLFSDGDLAAVALSELEKDPDLDPATLKDGTYASVTAAPGDGTLPEAAESALKGLQTDQWSQPVETEAGVYLLRPAALDEDAAGDLWFDGRLQDLAADAPVTLAEEYGSFTAASFYKGLCAARVGGK